MQVTTTISKKVTFKVFLLGIDQTTKYGQMYREAVIQYKVLIQLSNMSNLK